MGRAARERLPAVALALTASALLLFAPPAPPAEAGKRVKGKQLARELHRQLVARDLDPSFVGACRKLKGKRVHQCKWYAEGVWEDVEPYFCKGLARYRPRRERWRIERCRNLRPQLAPVSSERGPHRLFGYNEIFDPTSAEIALLARSGADSLRRVATWATVERRRGEFDWTHHDQIYAELRAAGIKPLWIATSAPCWATGRRCGAPSTPPDADHVDEFASFTAKLARRYPESLGIEIWNEQNFSMFWRGKIDPGLYGDMLAASAKAIHRVDPEMPVVLGGLAALTERSAGPDDMPFAPYLAKLYRSGAMEGVDAIAYHPYPGGGPGSRFLRVIRIQIGNLLDVMTAHNDPDRPIWITETGLSTAGPVPFSEAQQASGLVAIYDMFRHMPQVPVVQFHRFVDTPVNGISREEGFGVVRENGRDPKPAFCALAREREETVCF